MGLGLPLTDSNGPVKLTLAVPVRLELVVEEGVDTTVRRPVPFIDTSYQEGRLCLIVEDIVISFTGFGSFDRTEH